MTNINTTKQCSVATCLEQLVIPEAVVGDPVNARDPSPAAQDDNATAGMTSTSDDNVDTYKECGCKDLLTNVVGLTSLAALFVVGGDEGRIGEAELSKDGPARMAERLAARLHDSMRASLRTVSETEKAADGQPLRESRWELIEYREEIYHSIPERFKRTIADEGHTAKVADVANLDFERLPRKYRSEVLASATSAVQVILNEHADGDVDIESVASRVHEQWRARRRAENEFIGTGFDVPYDELYEEDKARYRTIANEAVNGLNEVIDLARQAYAWFQNNHSSIEVPAVKGKWEKYGAEMRASLVQELLLLAAGKGRPGARVEINDNTMSGAIETLNAMEDESKLVMGIGPDIEDIVSKFKVSLRRLNGLYLTALRGRRAGIEWVAGGIFGSWNLSVIWKRLQEAESVLGQFATTSLPIEPTRKFNAFRDMWLAVRKVRTSLWDSGALASNQEIARAISGIREIVRTELGIEGNLTNEALHAAGIRMGAVERPEPPKKAPERPRVMRRRPERR